MRSSLFSAIGLIFSLCTMECLFAQDSIRTEVFTLSTCLPNNYSLIKNLGENVTGREYVKKLEVQSNKPSVFQITGINPLRYKYYINNEAVTQFMESSPLSLSINTFVNGDYLNVAPEITVPEIFKVDSISAKVKVKIREFQANNKKLEDSIESADGSVSERWNQLYEEVRKANPHKTQSFWDSVTAIRSNYDNQYRLLYKRLDHFRIVHDRNLKEYQMYISGLPLNNPKFEILDQYRDTITTPYLDKEIDSIKAFQRRFAEQYRLHDDRFKKIDSLLFLLESNQTGPAGNDPAFRLLMHLLRYYHFNWSIQRYNSFGYYSQRDFLNDNMNDVHEQILNKRFQLYEEFVLTVATRIGVLVQNQFREYSSFDNALQNFTCIDSNTLKSVNRMRKKLIESFAFIQKTSAELQIMVSYLDINTDLYQSIAKKINSNYVFLLSYLKDLDYVRKWNTEQFTLPTHSNLKNIDLIRYTVRREDKITKGSQTYNYDFWLKGGLKIDFSIGFFGSRLTDNVYNKVLLDTAGGIDKIRITRQDDGRVNFAFGGMVNITPRNGASWINVGGSIGVAYSGNQKLQVLSGLALHFGKTERLIIQGGVAFGTIKYLDISANNFKFFDRDLKSVEREKLGDVKEKDRVYMLESEDIKFSSYSIPTVEKFVIRPFIGISYNLSKKNALQAVSGAGVKTFADNYANAVTY